MAPIIYFLIQLWWFTWYNFQIMQYNFELCFSKCLFDMMDKPLGTKVDSNYQAFHHWIVHVLQEKWYLKVSFGGSVGATVSLSDWLQHVEIEGLILWLEIQKILQFIARIKVGLGHASAQIKKFLNDKL